MNTDAHLLGRRKADGRIDVHAHFSMPKSAVELRGALKLMRADCFHASQPFEWSWRARWSTWTAAGLRCSS